MATKTAEAQSCPGCGSPAKIDGGARRWRVLCSKNTQTLHSPCQKAGHVMLSKRVGRDSCKTQQKQA